MQGPFPRVRLRADSHMPATQCCAARNPPLFGSQRMLVALAASQLGATPPKVSAARPHCGRAPTHATVPLGGPSPLITPFSRGGADQESRVAVDVHQQKPCPARPPRHRAREGAPPAPRTESAATRDRMLPNFTCRDACAIVYVCLTAIVPIWVFDPRFDTVADTFGSHTVRKCTNVYPNASGMVGR